MFRLGGRGLGGRGLRCSFRRGRGGRSGCGRLFERLVLVGFLLGGLWMGVLGVG